MTWPRSSQIKTIAWSRINYLRLAAGLMENWYGFPETCAGAVEVLRLQRAAAAASASHVSCAEQAQL
jgi:hypothetical protein